MKDNKLIVFKHEHFTKTCSLFTSQLGRFSFSSQLETKKEHFCEN